MVDRQVFGVTLEFLHQPAELLLKFRWAWVIRWVRELQWMARIIDRL